MNARIHRPAETTMEHTRILRVMLAVEDSVAYWRAAGPRGDVPGTPTERLRAAFDGRWFGTKTEARVKTLLGDMALRFDAYPEALAALGSWRPPADVVPWICHVHTQLADPIYREFTGSYLPHRRTQGYASVDRQVVAQWVQERWSGRWSPVTCLKFGSNLLATAAEAGFFAERKDPRPLTAPRPPRLAVEYVLYVLREIETQASLLESPYLRALSRDPADPAHVFGDVRAAKLRGLGSVHELTWEFPDLSAWVLHQRGAE